MAAADSAPSRGGSMPPGAVDRASGWWRSSRAMCARCRPGSRCSGTENRHDKVRPLGNPPDAEGEAEIVLVIRKLPPPPGDIDKAAHAEGRVQGKARKRLSGALELALQRVVRENQRLTQIAEKIA